jgi:hypothetical protein
MTSQYAIIKNGTGSYLKKYLEWDSHRWTGGPVEGAIFAIAGTGASRFKFFVQVLRENVPEFTADTNLDYSGLPGKPF